MFFLAEEQAAAAASTFEPFDIIMLLFTVIIFIGLIRLVMARPRKKFVRDRIYCCSFDCIPGCRLHYDYADLVI